MKFINLLCLSVLLLSFQAYGAKCSKSSIVTNTKKACEIWKKSKMAGCEEIKKLKYCRGSYNWVQSAVNENYVILCHQTKKLVSTMEKPKKLLGKAVGGLLLFDLLNDFGLKSNATEGQWIRYMWAKPGQDHLSPKDTYLLKCDDAVIGGGAWNCKDCPKVDTPAKYKK